MEMRRVEAIYESPADARVTHMYTSWARATGSDIDAGGGSLYRCHERYDTTLVQVEEKARAHAMMYFMP